jgi:hypothetical protein
MIYATVRDHGGRVIAQAVSHRLLTAEARFRAHGSPCGICGGQSDTGTGFSPSPLVFLCQYHSTTDHLEDGQRTC